MTNLMKMNKTVLLCILFFMSIAVYAQQPERSSQTYFEKGSLSLRSNAVPWLMLMPNAGFEYKPSDNIGLIVDGAFAHWSLNTTNKYWHLWNVAPQVRYYIGELKDNYLGLQYMMGSYNLTGKQGSYMGGGLTLGHQFDCGQNLLVDVGISLGYLYLYDTEEYTRKNNVNVRTKDKYSHGYWGPTSASITFVWKIN
ncbi:DUF3575 domain-containing protein [Dysgonomonas sp. Marseille-P4677]|uniref:DUF3575 domain-containing protein n=1 Tax=Dysgonomonas sp. Marseille-P4677 TaxID=2364790 RepID=UPI001913A6A9|nr:DUF3575 domain-containing protein [Dysgonomonas sp. Marseille-P4677]MBK5720795.1 DUF3575 domain-containing protein [Dysgonomonas sp. Marseille-P4677]